MTLAKKKFTIAPGCQHKLILRRGNRNIAHFAHYSRSCQLFSEGETKEHLQGKEFLFQALTAAKWQVEYEAYQSQLRQRPDILGRQDGKLTVAFEYQCAPLSLTKLIQRSKGYKSGNLAYIWFLGKRYFLKTRLNQQTAMFMRWSKNLGFYLLYLDTVYKRFEVDYAIQQADFLPIKYLRYYAYSFEELVKFLHTDHMVCYYPLTTEQLLLQEYKFKQQIYYGSKVLADLRNFCYSKSLTLADLPKQVFTDTYYPPIYRKPLLLSKSFFYLNYPDKKQILADSLFSLPFVQIVEHLRTFQNYN